MTLKINSFKEAIFDQATLPNAILSKLKTSLSHGFFYVEIPQECRALLPAARLFATKIKDNKEYYKSFNFEKPTGFERVEGTQTYALIVRSNQWNEVYESNEQLLAKNMQSTGVKIFKCLLKHILKIPESQWEQITGKALTDQGRPVFSVMSYSPELVADEGYFPHQDIGWITLLCSDKKGLVAQFDDTWHDVPLKPNHYTVMFGGMMEELFNNKAELSAPSHYVTKLNEDRVTLGLFINSEDDQHIHVRMQNGEIRKTEFTFRHHIEKGLKKYLAQQQLKKSGTINTTTTTIEPA